MAKPRSSDGIVSEVILRTLAIYGRFEVPALTDLVSMTRGDWEAFWDWRLKPGGGRAPGSESELDDSDDGQEPSKQSSRECKTISPWENKQGRNMMGVRL